MVDRSASHWPITVTNGIAAFLSIGLPLGLIRIVSPDDVGLYNIFFLYVMVMPGLFLTGGLNNGLYHWAGKTPEAKEELRQSWTLIIAITVVASIIGLLLTPLISPLVKIPRTSYILLLVSSPFNMGALFLEDFMIARGQIWLGSWFGSGSNVFRTAMLLAVVWVTRDMEWVFGAFLVTSIIRILVGLFLLRDAPELRFVFSRERAKNVLRYSFPVSIAGAAALLLHYVDQMLLSVRLLPAQFAYYAVGCLSVPPLEILSISVNKVLIPQMSHALNLGDRRRAARLFSESVAELFRILMPATVGLVLYAKPIIIVLFTERYLPSVRYLELYAFTYVLMALPYDAIARALGDGGWIFRMSVFFAALSVGTAWIAAGLWGAMGALSAVLLSQLAMRVYSLQYGRKRLELLYSDFLPFKSMAMQTVFAIVCLVISVALRPLFADPRIWFFVTGPIFTLIYFAMSYLFVRRSSPIDLDGNPLGVMELTQTLCLGGLERTVCSLAQSLRHDPEITVVVGVYEHPADQVSLLPTLRQSDVSVVEWNKGDGFTFKSVRHLVHLLQTHRISVLHVHDLGPLVYGSLAKLLMLKPVRMISTVHTLKYILESSRHRLFYRVFLNMCESIVAVSPEVKQGLVDIGIRPGRVVVIENGVSFPETSQGLESPETRIAFRKNLLPNLVFKDPYTSLWILYLARLHPGKGHELMLSIWSALPKSVRESCVLLFVGQETQAGHQNVLSSIAASSANPERIVFVGPSENPQNWIQYSDIFVSGSALEGRPLAPLEAAGAGLPLLLSDIDGHRFLKPWATYFDVNNPADGAAKLTQLAALVAQQKSESALERWNAAQPIRDQWDMAAMTKQYRALFQALASPQNH